MSWRSNLSEVRSDRHLAGQVSQSTGRPCEAVSATEHRPNAERIIIGRAVFGWPPGSPVGGWPLVFRTGQAKELLSSEDQSADGRL